MALADLAVPEPEPERGEDPAVAARVRVPRVAAQAARRTAELLLQRRHRRAHALAARLHGRERPREPEQRHVERGIAERTQVAPVEVAPELALDRGADDLGRNPVPLDQSRLVP